MTGGDRAGTRAAQAAALVEDLARGSAPGTRLGTKTELRETCGVSVGTFNEALRLLQSRGIVEVRPGPGGGLFVAEQTPMVRLGHSVLALDRDETSVADAIRIRDALDPLLCHDAAWHSSPAEVARYFAEIEAMAVAKAAASVPDFMAANWRLHVLIAEVNPSPVLRSLYLALLDLIRSHTREVRPAEGNTAAEAMETRYRIHADLIEAIARQDTEAITEAVQAHSTAEARPGSRRASPRELARVPPPGARPSALRWRVVRTSLMSSSRAVRGCLPRSAVAGVLTTGALLPRGRPGTDRRRNSGGWSRRWRSGG